MKIKFKISNSRGVTLVEIIIVALLVVLFSAVAIFSMQKTQEALSLVRSAHKLSQDLRKTQDLSLSGAEATDASGNKIKISGYGIFLRKIGENRNSTGELIANKKAYLIYADSHIVDGKYDYEYSDDYVIETINVDPEKRGVYVKNVLISNASASDTENDYASIDFTPPNPSTTMTGNVTTSSGTSIKIVLGIESDDELEKVVSVNSSGLIEISD